MRAVKGTVTSLNDLSQELKETSRRSMLSFLRSLSISLLCILDMNPINYTIEIIRGMMLRS